MSLTDRCVVCLQGKPDDCSKSSVVYQIQCSCSAVYIGKRGRCINVRLREHLSAKSRMSMNVPLAKYRHDCHNGEVMK